MYYSEEYVAQCSQKLQKLLWEQDRIEKSTGDSLALDSVLAKIIRFAREEKLGFIYISAVYDMLHFQIYSNEARKAIQYAELFLREGRAIIEEALPTDANASTIRCNYSACFELIGNAYMGFYQISTAKMEQFFKLYQETVRSCGRELLFYECILRWEIMCVNTEAVKKICKHYGTIPLDGLCYVCINREVNRARILFGDVDGALAFSADIISGNIPAEALDRYERCEDADAYSQYSLLFETCLECGKIELLEKVLPLVYKEILANEQNESIDCSDALVCALYGDFARCDDYIKEACNRIDCQKRYMPYDYMYFCLMWMIYFERLERSGVERIPFPTKNPLSLEVDSAGQYSVSEIGNYFEQVADEIGMQFEKSRDQFAYEQRKLCFKSL